MEFSFSKFIKDKFLPGFSRGLLKGQLLKPQIKLPQLYWANHMDSYHTPSLRSL